MYFRQIDICQWNLTCLSLDLVFLIYGGIVGVFLVLLTLHSSLLPCLILPCSARSQHLEEVAASLRERIKHLDDMVHCQQKKVKHMVEEVRSRKTILSLLGALILLVHNPKRALFCVQFPSATLVTNTVEDELGVWS